MKIKHEDIEIHQMTVDEIDTYLEFINKVKATMEHPEWLGDFTKEDLVNLLNTNSYGFLFKYNDLIVGSSILIPAREKDIKKFELDLDYTKTMDYGPEGVLKEAQGNAIQLFILEKMDEFAKSKGYNYAVSTVHPDNIFCIRNMEKHRFKYHKTKEFTRGIRNIYQKSI